MPPKPHLVWVVADDLGVGDVVFAQPDAALASDLATPRLDALAASGLVLDSYYVQPLCTPSRAAFMTGRHPVQLGLQHGVIRDAVPDALPMGEALLPAMLRDAGYATHHVGKWHLGFAQPQYTPERRGFDSSLGYYTGNAEYWNHTSPCWGCGNYTAVDLHYANATHWVGLLSPSTLGLYSTDLFAAAAVGTIASHAASHGAGPDATPLFLYAAFEAAHGAASCFREGQPPDCETPDDDELQAPARYIELQAAASSVERREYGGMVSALDAAVGAIADALSANGMYSRSLLLFSSDNGAPHRHLGGRAMSNYPLRGGKAELWEGGVRGAAFVAGGALPPSAGGRRSLALLHATDWLPTLLRLAGARPGGAPLYGVDATRLLADPDSVGRYELRRELLLNHDSVTGKAALRVGPHKLVRNEAASGWGARLGGRREEEATAAVGEPPGDQLFDLEADPRETRNLAAEAQHAPTLARLALRLDALASLAIEPRSLPPDPAARPPPLAAAARCTPSPAGPILCNVPLGIWQPWRPDGWDATSLGASAHADPFGPSSAPERDGAAGLWQLGAAGAGTGGALFALSLCAPLGIALWLCRRGRLARAAQPDSDGDAQLRASTDVAWAAGAESPVGRSKDAAGPDATPDAASEAAGRSADGQRVRRPPAGRLSALCGSYLSLEVSDADPARSRHGLLPLAGGLRAAPAAALLPCALLAFLTMLLLARLGAGGFGGGESVPPPPLAAARVWPAGVSVLMETAHHAHGGLAHPAAAALLASVSAAQAPPRCHSVVLFITDDQDQKLGAGFDPDAPDAPTPMPRTRSLLGGSGATFRRFFAHTPVCCPSRAELLTGRYLHNLRVDPLRRPSDAVEECMRVDGTRVNNRSFALALQGAGYATGLFGKYLNRWPSSYTPRGFDAFLGNGGDMYIAPSFVARGVEGVLGIADGAWASAGAPQLVAGGPLGSSNYSTSIIGNASVSWLRAVAPHARTRPFFAYIAPKAAHEPFLPAPWHADAWDDAWPWREPRPDAWNASKEQRAGLHGVLATNPQLSARAAEVVSGIHRNRWRTLLSVDELVSSVLATLAAAGVLADTYVLYTSDNGFALGELSLTMDKRHAYDYHTRVPLLVRGPGIAPSSVVDQPCTIADLAPTILAMAGVQRPTSLAPFDGKSLLPLLVTDGALAALAPPTREALATALLGAGGREALLRSWRRAVLLEHLYFGNNTKCVRECGFGALLPGDAAERARQLAALGPAGAYPRAELWCANLEERSTCWATPDAPDRWCLPRCVADCYDTEDPTNNFAALRHFGAGPLGPEGSLYAEFQTGVHAEPHAVDFSRVDHRELFSGRDEWQTRNLLWGGGAGAYAEAAEAAHQELHRWLGCSGDQCP